MTGNGIPAAFCSPLRLPSSGQIPIAVCSKMRPAGSPRAKSSSDSREGKTKNKERGKKVREASPPAVAGMPGKPSCSPAAPAPAARARCLLQRGQQPPASSHLPGTSPARSGVAAGSLGTACEAGEGRGLGKSFGKKGWGGGKHRSAPGCHRAPTTGRTHAMASGTHAGENTLTGARSAPDPQEQQPALFPSAGF